MLRIKKIFYFCTRVGVYYAQIARSFNMNLIEIFRRNDLII